ncbi:inositol polyphosphate kinase-domain-containing protein [Tuber brumale]|nr:inositol polyphosphate kinase-domain-containing protein [Tuber brumale]
MASSDLKASYLRAYDLVAARHYGVLSDESGALVIKPCTACELSSPEPAEGPVPTAGPATHGRNTSIVLQNLTCGFDEACEKHDPLDVVSNATTSHSLGPRIAGMKVWKGKAAGGYKVFDKQQGRTITADNCLEAVKVYLSADISEEHEKWIAERFLKKVTEAREVLEGMYSASLLFDYEGGGKALETALKQEEENAKKPQKDEDYDSEDQKVKKVEELKLIDFAHANWTPGKGPDENALQGVRSTQRLLAELVG